MTGTETETALNARLLRTHSKEWLELRVYAAQARDCSKGERRKKAETLVKLLDVFDDVRDNPAIAPGLWRSCRMLERQLLEGK